MSAGFWLSCCNDSKGACEIACALHVGEAVVAAERHYDPMRAQLTAASAAGGAAALISFGLAPLLNLTAPALLSVESAFWSFLVAATAGDASASAAHIPVCSFYRSPSCTLSTAYCCVIPLQIRFQQLLPSSSM